MVDVSWLIPSVAHHLPDLEPFGREWLSPSSLQRALQRSEFGLRLVGYPTAVLQELFDSTATSSSASDVADDGGFFPSRD